MAWVRRCVTSHSYLVLVNGCPNWGWIHPKKGVRQGYPFAPLPFVQAVDAPAKCTIKACSHGLLRGFQMMSYSGGICGGGKESLHAFKPLCRFLRPTQEESVSLCKE